MQRGWTHLDVPTLPSWHSPEHASRVGRAGGRGPGPLFLSWPGCPVGNGCTSRLNCGRRRSEPHFGPRSKGASLVPLSREQQFSSGASPVYGGPPQALGLSHSSPPLSAPGVVAWGQTGLLRVTSTQQQDLPLRVFAELNGELARAWGNPCPGVGRAALGHRPVSGKGGGSSRSAGPASGLVWFPG